MRKEIASKLYGDFARTHFPKVHQACRTHRRISVLHLVIIRSRHRDVHAAGALGYFMGRLAPPLPMFQRAIPEQAQTKMEKACPSVDVVVVWALARLHDL